jgi:hypothetical protein
MKKTKRREGESGGEEGEGNDEERLPEMGEEEGGE